MCWPTQNSPFPGRRPERISGPRPEHRAQSDSYQVEFKIGKLRLTDRDRPHRARSAPDLAALGRFEPNDRRLANDRKRRNRVIWVYPGEGPETTQPTHLQAASRRSVEGQIERFPPTRLSVRCRIGQATFAGASSGDCLAPKLDISVKAVVLPLSPHRGIDTHFY